MITVLQFIFSLVSDFWGALVDAFTSPKAFNAEFGSERLIASRWNKGFVISAHRKLTRKASYQSLMIVAVTGGGKTTKFLIPTILTMTKCSFLINDGSKEIHHLTSGHLQKIGFAIKTINLSDYKKSCGYNPFARIKNDNDIDKIVHIIVSITLDKGSGGDMFWSLSVKSLLQILIRVVLLQAEHLRNIATLVELVNVLCATPEKIDLLVAQSNDKKLILQYQSFIATPERTMSNIIASAKAALQPFSSDDTLKILSNDDISFEELRQHPTAIYLQIGAGDAKFHNVIIACFFEQFYNYGLDKIPTKSELDVFCLIDEASSLYINLLPLALANGRKFRLGTIIAVQAKNQLKTFYKDEAENIASNCVTKIVLGGLTAIDELREIETLSGKCIYKDEKGERVKPLISADEVRLLPENRSIILSSNHPIIKGRVAPFWKNLILKRRASIPPAPLEGTIPDTPLPTLF